MSDIIATLRVESPALALTETVAYDETATVEPVSGAGTVPNLGAHLFSVRTDDFERFETGLDRDRTIDTFERVVELGTEAVYRFEYDAEATVFSGAIAEVNGISLAWVNDDTAWTVQVWLPDRAALASLWEYASDCDIDVSLERVSDHAGGGESETLTRAQRDALRRALEMGYFEEPRDASLSEVAAELGISQPAAGGRLRRGVRRLVVSTVANDTDDPRDET
jgi:predicted DNA binding protein